MPENAITQDDREIFYTAVADQTEFPVTFKFQQNQDLEVGTVAEDGAFTELSLGADYQVSGAEGDNGGNVSLVVPATDDTLYRIRGKATLELNKKLTGARYSPATTNSLFERCLIWIVENTRDVGAVNAIIDTLSNITLPALNALGVTMGEQVTAATQAKTDTQDIRDEVIDLKKAAEDAAEAAEEATPPFPISQVIDLQDGLDGKAEATHNHAISDITNVHSNFNLEAGTFVTSVPVLRVLTSSTTWAKPAKLAYLVIEVWGGGAAGGASGTGGGTTSFGAHAIATGGATVGSNANNTYPSRGGVGTSGDVLLRGQSGGSMGASGYGGMAGSAPRGGGGGGYQYPVGTAIHDGGEFGGGGASSTTGKGHGGGGGYAMAIVDADNLSATELVTVGAGGTPDGTNGAGGAGGVIVTEYYNG
ncbi:hypothetical protein [Cohaesibacter celericrescens]|uniref:hypothetical protein n=1 Tax=Cohaesibacter celericrescens TaxID=2067669 RepID=UPI0015E0AC84|nr:hypothetical protein [Cohaesibacter celericrescens]